MKVQQRHGPNATKKTARPNRPAGSPPHTAKHELVIAFKPNRDQLAALAWWLTNPACVPLPEVIGEAIQVPAPVIVRWHTDPAFRAWWYSNLLVECRTASGEIAAALRAFVHNPRFSDGSRVKACEVLLRYVGDHAPPTTHSVRALLQELRGAPAGTEIVIAARVPQALGQQHPEAVELPGSRQGGVLEITATEAEVKSPTPASAEQSAGFATQRDDDDASDAAGASEAGARGSPGAAARGPRLRDG